MKKTTTRVGALPDPQGGKMRTYTISEYGVGRVDIVEAKTATEALWAAVDCVDEQMAPDGTIRLSAYWSDGEHESDFAEGMFERDEAGEWEWSRVAWRRGLKKKGIPFWLSGIRQTGQQLRRYEK